MGGLLGGGGGGGGSSSGASNPFAGAGGGFTGAATDLYPSDPNAYDYSGGGQGGAPNAYAYSGQTLGDASTMDQGSTQSAQNAPQQIQAGSTPAPPDQTPAGQQSGSAQPSLLEDVSNVLLGKGTSDVVGANQAGATSAGAAGGPPTPTQSFGWTMPTGQQTPGQTNLMGTTFFDPRQTQRPSPATPATPPATPTTPPATPGPATAAPAQPPPAPAANTPDQLPLPPMPFPTEGTQTADATVPPQSSTATSGNKTETSTPDATAPAATTPPAAAGPDLMGSSRESGMGPTTPGYYDPRTGGAQGVQQGIGSKGNALGDLFQGNFGKFLGDLFGGGGQPGGQPGSPYASSQPPDTGGATTSTSPAPQTAQAGVPDMEQSGPRGLGSPNRFGMYQTPSGLPQETEAPGTAGNVASYPGQPGVSRGQMGFLPGPQGPGYGVDTAAAGQPAPTTPPAQAATPKQPGTAAAALPPAGQPAGTPGTMTVGPPGPINTPPGGQPMPDGSRQPTNGMPGGTTPNAPPAAAGYGAIPNQANRPRQYGGEITMPDGSKFKYSTGGGQFASLPYGTYHINPGAIGSTGRRIGAWAGIGDSGSGNTVNDPLYRGAGGGHARDGVEIHPDVDPSGRGRTNGCIGINRAQANAFGQAFKSAAAKGPMILTVRPDGSASISYASGSPAMAAAGNAPRWANALPGAGGTQANPTQGAAAPRNIRYTRGDRNMNPGNIKMGPDARQFGATGVDNQGHAIFPSVEAGIQAQASLLRRNYSGKTIPEMGRSYAQDRGWARGVMAAGGFKPNERLNLYDQGTMDRLQRAIWKQEGTHPNVASAQSPIRLASSSNEISPEMARQIEQQNNEIGASSTTYQDELLKRGRENVSNQLGYVPGAGLLEQIIRRTMTPTRIGKDWRDPTLRDKAGYYDIEGPP